MDELRNVWLEMVHILVHDATGFVSKPLIALGGPLEDQRLMVCTLLAIIFVVYSVSGILNAVMLTRIRTEVMTFTRSHVNAQYLLTQ